MDAYIARPDDDATHPAVIIAHQLFGLTPDVLEFADELARAGYVALAPNFYHRDGQGIALPMDDTGRTRGFELLGRVTRDGAVTDFRSALDYLAAHDAGPVGALGVSFGGHLTYLAATRLPIPVAVVLYGGWLTGTEIAVSQPNPTIELTPGISGRLVYVVGDADHVISAGEREAIGKALDEAGKGDLVVFPDAPHAYLSPGTPSYRAEASARTWELIHRELGALRGPEPS